MTEDQARKLDAIHDALYGVPDGSVDGEQPLIADIRRVVQAYKRANWLGRFALWAVITLSTLVAAIKSLWPWGS